MTAQELADLHAAAFVQGRPWRAAEFEALLASRAVTLLTRPAGFALVRTVAGEAELLTLAVDPARQRQGIARKLMRDWFARTEADFAFLEVAADNLPARALYSGFGFCKVGRRPGYYARPDAPAVDALVLRRALTIGQGCDSPPNPAESG